MNSDKPTSDRQSARFTFHVSRSTLHASRFTSHAPRSTSLPAAAFTLIELLVVIAIIAILAALIFPVTGAVKRAQIKTKARAELAQVQLAIDNYKSKLGHYPPDNPGNPSVNPLYFELLGTTNTGTTTAPFYVTLDGSARIAGSALKTDLGRVAGFVNCTPAGGGDEVRFATPFIAGLKATYGRVSRYGLAPLSWSLDHCGPMARVVEDTAHMLQAIAGHDPKDPTSSAAPVADYAGALRENVKGMVIGVPRDYISECAPRTESIVLKLVDTAIEDLKSLGARLEEVKVPILHLATLANAVIYYNEFWAAHKSDAAWVLKNGAAQRRARIYLGILTNSADYIQAQRVRSRLRAEFAEVFNRVDCLALPCQAGPAPLVKDVGPIDTLFKHVVPEYHGPFNLVGLPTLSVPCGFSEKKLPVALQLVGRPFDEVTILRAGYTYQQHLRWFERRPPI